MGQQALKTKVLGSTLIVDARLNLNMQSLTLEQVAAKRRTLIVDAKMTRGGRSDDATRPMMAADAPTLHDLSAP